MLLNEVNDNEMLEIQLNIDIHDLNKYNLYGYNFMIRKYDKVYDRYHNKFYNYDELFHLNFFKYKYIYINLCPLRGFPTLLTNLFSEKLKEKIENDILNLVMHFCCAPDKIIIFNNIGNNKELINKLNILINPCNKVYYNPIIKYKKNKIIIKSNN